MLTKQLFLMQLKEFEEIQNRDEKIERCRDFLLHNCSQEMKELRYFDGEKVLRYIKRFYMYRVQDYENVYVKDVMGTGHPNYIDVSPYMMVNGSAQRIDNRLLDLIARPVNYFTGELKDKDISPDSFNDKDNNRKYIIQGGNHRFSISKVINSFVEDELFIKDLFVTNYFVDWEVPLLINKAKNSLIPKHQGLFIKYNQIKENNITYNIVESLEVSYKDRNERVIYKEFNKVSDNLKELEEENRLELKHICSDIHKYIKEETSLLYSVKRRLLVLLKEFEF